MRSIIELGKQGGDNLGNYDTPGAIETDTELLMMLTGIKEAFPQQIIEAETDEGIKRSLGVRVLPLYKSNVFALAHRLAAYEPMVYAQSGGRRVMGMLSANFNESGEYRLPSIKIIPLQTAYPLTNTLKPDARMGTMLSAAVGGERQGVGGHTGRVASDLEHKATILGAVSVGDASLAISHANHGVRSTSSVATGLTNGTLGNLYEKNDSVSDFPGYGSPLTIHEATAAPTDMLFIPDSFLDSEEAFGGYYAGAPRIMLGAGQQALYLRHGTAVIRNQIAAISKRVV